MKKQGIQYARMSIPAQPSSHQPFGELTLAEVDLSLLTLGSRDQNQVLSKYKNIHGGQVFSPIKLPKRFVPSRRATSSLLREPQNREGLQKWINPSTWLQYVTSRSIRKAMLCGRISPADRLIRSRRRAICKQIENRTNVILGSSSPQEAVVEVTRKRQYRLDPIEGTRYVSGIDNESTNPVFAYEDGEEDIQFTDSDYNEDGLLGVSIGAIMQGTQVIEGAAVDQAPSTSNEGKDRLDYAERIFASAAESLTVDGQTAGSFAWHPFQSKFAISLEDDSVAIGELMHPKNSTFSGPFGQRQNPSSLKPSLSESTNEDGTESVKQAYPWLCQLLNHPLMTGVRDMSFCPVTGTMLAVGCAHGIMLWVFNRSYPRLDTSITNQSDIDGNVISRSAPAMYTTSEPIASLSSLMTIAAACDLTDNSKPAFEMKSARESVSSSKSLAFGVASKDHSQSPLGSSIKVPKSYETAHVVLLTTARCASLGPVQKCVFSPCGRFIAAAHRDSSSIVVWDVSLARAAALVNPPIVGSESHKVLVASAASAATAAVRQGVTLFSADASLAFELNSNAILNAVRPGTALGDVSKACVFVIDSLESKILAKGSTFSAVSNLIVGAASKTSQSIRSIVQHTQSVLGSKDADSNGDSATDKKNADKEDDDYFISPLAHAADATRKHVVSMLSGSVKELLWSPEGGVLFVSYKHNPAFTLVDTHGWRAESYDTADGMPIAAAAWAPRRGCALLFSTENSSKVYSITLPAPSQTPILPVITVEGAGSGFKAPTSTNVQQAFSQMQPIPQHYGTITRTSVLADRMNPILSQDSSRRTLDRLSIVSTSIVFDMLQTCVNATSADSSSDMAPQDFQQLGIVAAVSHGLSEIDHASLCVDSIAWSPTCDRVILSFKTKRTNSLLRRARPHASTKQSLWSSVLGIKNQEVEPASKFDAPSLAELALAPMDEMTKLPLTTYSAPGTELMLLLDAPIGLTVKLSPIGFVRGPPATPCHETEMRDQSELNRPLKLSFAPCFDRGALLGVVWRSGYLTFLPMYFTAAAASSQSHVSGKDTLSFLS